VARPSFFVIRSICARVLLADGIRYTRSQSCMSQSTRKNKEPGEYHCREQSEFFYPWLEIAC